MVSELHTKPNLDNCMVRGGRIEDIGFILDSWCASYAESPIVREIDPEVVKVEQRARVRRLLTQAKVTVVCDTKDPTIILGWLCHSIDKATNYPVLHYAYVLKGSRNHKVFTTLTHMAGWRPGTVAWMTHWQPCVRKLVKKFDGFVYNPYMLEVQ